MQHKPTNNKNKLTDWTKSLEFMRDMTEVFTNYDVYSNGEIKKLNQNQVQQARSAGCAAGPTQIDSKCLVKLLHMSEITESEADEILKSNNCLLCRFPKSHTKNHHMTTCGFLKKYSISCAYDRSTDMRVPEKFWTKVNNR